MKASYLWLKELLPTLTASPREVAEQLTKGGLEVEGTHEFGAGAEHCLVVAVVALKPHPTKSGLRLVTVDRGNGTQEVVCGAPNVPEPGGLVVLAPLGAYLPAKDLTIAPRAIAGVTSEGMLCSESELGLSDESDGILIIPPGTAKPGTTLAAALPQARDTVFEIGLTPNRPDGLGHIGLARDLATHLGLEFAWPSTGAVAKTSGQATTTLVTITVDDAERCPHYGAAGAVDVRVGPSPLWLKLRLQALGVRSISNVVDITNLVMLEYGHPMHAFDLDRVRPDAGGKPAIIVRRATDGEPITTLDGVDRKMIADDLLICDGQGPVAIAGVMGGADSEIRTETTRVLYECAWFDPRSVRRTARRQGMHTESSHRFERGVDPGDVARVLDRAVALTTTLAGGAATAGRIHVQGAHVGRDPLAIANKVIRFHAARVAAVTGVAVPFAHAVAILKRLGCVLDDADAESCDVHLPTHRPDLTREVDLVDEVIRIHGMDNVPAELPPIRASRDVGGREELLRRAKEVCATLGLSEAITFSFTSHKSLEALSAPAPAVVLENPMSELQAVLRTSLLVGLLDAVKNARRHGERNVREFTVGPVFLAPGAASGGLPTEKTRLAFALAGDRAGWLEKPKPLDVWDAKGYVEEIVRRLSGVQPVIVQATREEAPKHLHPRGAAFVEVDGKRVGDFGLLHPDAVEALDLDGNVLVFELELDALALGPIVPKFAPIPRFPASIRDVSLVVRDGVQAGELEAAVRDAAGPLASNVRLFDRFVGGSIPAGHTSYTIRVVYRSTEKTLTDADVDKAHANVSATTNARFGATLRA